MSTLDTFATPRHDIAISNFLLSYAPHLGLTVSKFNTNYAIFSPSKISSDNIFPSYSDDKLIYY